MGIRNGGVRIIDHLWLLFWIQVRLEKYLNLSPIKPEIKCSLLLANLLGNMAIPLALVVLGSSFARLHIPRSISRLPITAMFAVASFKMIILPIVGVSMVQGMVRSGMVNRESKAERFVLIFLSGTPAAVKYALSCFSFFLFSL